MLRLVSSSTSIQCCRAHPAADYSVGDSALLPQTIPRQTSFAPLALHARYYIVPGTTALLPVLVSWTVLVGYTTVGGLLASLLFNPTHPLCGRLPKICCKSFSRSNNVCPAASAHLSVSIIAVELLPGVLQGTGIRTTVRLHHGQSPLRA